MARPTVSAIASTKPAPKAGASRPVDRSASASEPAKGIDA
jgi:hypothetical protein